MYVDFRVDVPYLVSGACTYIRWDVEGVQAVYLDGMGQVGHDAKEVCPTKTQTYVLHVVSNVGYLDRVVTILVLPAPTMTR